jgi:hypothetical protein
MSGEADPSADEAVSKSGKPNEPYFFYEDEVYRFQRGNLQFGMVVENSEFQSSDESDNEDDKRLKQGFVRVAWHPKGHEEVIREKKASCVCVLVAVCWNNFDLLNSNFFNSFFRFFFFRLMFQTDVNSFEFFEHASVI